MTNFQDRVVLITGASSGIGRELCHQLSALGAKVGGIDFVDGPLPALGAELAGRPYAWARADVTDRAALNAAVASIESSLGPTDILIAGAGIGRETSALEDHAANVDAVVSVNLIGLSNSFSAVLPGMLHRKSGQLVALSSLASYAGLPRMAGYSASKAGVSALCDAYRVELKPHGIAVTILCPGFIKTPMTEHLKGVSKMELPDAVRRMISAIAARKAKVAFPFEPWLKVCLLRYTPRFISDWLAGKLARKVTIRE